MCLHLFRMRYDLYIQIYHQHSNFHNFRLYFWIFIIWWSKFRRGVLRDEFLVFEMCLGTSYVFSKNFLHTQIMFPFLPTSFFKKYLFSPTRLSKFITVEFFGMSSYGPESSSIKKYEFWRKFYIFIMSSYLL